MVIEYLIKEAISLVSDNEEIIPLRADQLHFKYKPYLDNDMVLDGWLVSKMYPKQDGNYVMVYKRTPNNNQFLVEI